MEGIDRLRASMSDKASRIPEAVARGLKVGIIRTVNWIGSNELQGQVLKQRSGRLVGSILNPPEPEIEGTTVRGFIKSVFYGRVHEYGATITINSPVNLEGIGWRYLSTVTIPERPFIRPGIDQNLEVIRGAIADAIREELKS
jgi:hypothetical protein